MNQTLDKQYVEARIADFERRVRELFKTVSGFFERLPGREALGIYEGTIWHDPEPPMKEFGVGRVLLPTLNICPREGSATPPTCLGFTPANIWVIGAYGRVNATTLKNNFILMDLALGEGLPSRWCIVTSRLRQVHDDFTFDIFRSLVEHQRLP